jgi:hypothetical protein
MTIIRSQDQHPRGSDPLLAEPTIAMAAPLLRGSNQALRPAGVKNYGADESAATALDLSARPPTPERVARYREVREPGARSKHTGIARDDWVDPEKFYGGFTKDRDTATAVMDNTKTPMEEYAEVRV